MAFVCELSIASLLCLVAHGATVPRYGCAFSWVEARRLATALVCRNAFLSRGYFPACSALDISARLVIVGRLALVAALVGLTVCVAAGTVVG